MYSPNQFQTQFFQTIFGAIKGKRKITQELMDVLGCSRASLYRKRTGTTPLTTDELIRLANHFSISIDALRSKPEENSQVVVCTTLPPIKDYGDIDFYLENTRKNLELAVAQPNAQLYFTAKEVPLYRYIDQPGLSAFRYYLWVMENMRRHERFDPLAIPHTLIHKGRDLTKLSEGIKTTEFWVAGAFDNLIGQIRYVDYNSRISVRVKNQLKEELHAVLDKLLNNILSEQTKEGKGYQMVLCNYLTLSDGALLEIGPNRSEVMFSYSSINYMKSSNPFLVEAFRRGLRYHKLEGQTIDSLEQETALAFIEDIREKVNAL
ncbi:MAG TPA: hypothetical protein DIT65_02515 [Cryomorphaceae bacterium]|nr:hypothetical protein [Cryomorphaceae bacterium]|tara:strand:+ start:1149 stop:2108 length:960 start_codon:yes stop_codon:yes gene_type:complete